MSTLSRLRAFPRRRSAPRCEPGPSSVTAALRDHEGRLRASRDFKAVTRREEEARALEAFRKLEAEIKFDKRVVPDDEAVAWVDGEPLTMAECMKRYGPKPKPLVLVGARGMKPYLMTYKERKAHKEALNAKV